HLHITDLHRAMDFYRDVVGFAGFLLIHSFGMGDVGLDYMPHTVAFNISSGPNAQLPAPGSAGLLWFTLELPDAQSISALQTKLETAKAPSLDSENGFETQDPFGNHIKIVVPA